MTKRKEERKKEKRRKLTIKNRPPPSSRNINPILHHRRENIIKIPLIIIGPPQIPQDRLQTLQLALKRLRETKLRDLNVRHAGEEVLGDFAQELAHARGSVVQPVGARVGGRACWEAVWCDLFGACAFRVAWVGGVAGAVGEVLDAVCEVGRVRVDGEKVAAACDEGFFVFRQGGQKVAESVFEDLRVVAVVPLWWVNDVSVIFADGTQSERKHIPDRC
ncbi:hypothetical protein BBD39_09195 [Arsenophonus endosymbiont of Bemisia tabaci Asia II 3]|nr:hypothetical protein BBD39_09195 [Arsenophonus endosymbiont of Bemisia tabaci Asia II 3]